ncbi:MAG: hypothetical protein R3F46_12575 [bacterium]
MTAAIVVLLAMLHTLPAIADSIAPPMEFGIWDDGNPFGQMYDRVLHFNWDGTVAGQSESDMASWSYEDGQLIEELRHHWDNLQLSELTYPQVYITPPDCPTDQRRVLVVNWRENDEYHASIHDLSTEELLTQLNLNRIFSARYNPNSIEHGSDFSQVVCVEDSGQGGFILLINTRRGPANTTHLGIWKDDDWLSITQLDHCGWPGLLDLDSEWRGRNYSRMYLGPGGELVLQRSDFSLEFRAPNDADKPFELIAECSYDQLATELFPEGDYPMIGYCPVGAPGWGEPDRSPKVPFNLDPRLWQEAVVALSVVFLLLCILISMRQPFWHGNAGIKH